MNSRTTILTISLAACLSGLLFNRAAAQPTTVPWQHQDIGPSSVPGSFTGTDKSLVLQSAGADIWGAEDSFHFAYFPLSGDIELVVRVIDVQKTDPWAKAGLMIRWDLSPGSPHAFLAMTPEKGAVFIRRIQPATRSKDDWHQGMRILKGAQRGTFQQRGSGGMENATDSIVASPNPRWLKLVRQGDVFTAYDSADGTTWEWLGTDSIAMPKDVFAGLALSSHEVSKVCTATFDPVTLSVPQAKGPPVLHGKGQGIPASYYDTMNLTGRAVKRLDPTIDFDWGAGSPFPDFPPDKFSVRWEGELEAPSTDPYSIQVISDDRARVWINGELVIDEWYEHAEATLAVLILTAPLPRTG